MTVPWVFRPNPLTQATNNRGVSEMEGLPYPDTDINVFNEGETTSNVGVSATRNGTADALGRPTQPQRRHGRRLRKATNRTTTAQ
jgi:hypothetical protein